MYAIPFLRSVATGQDGLIDAAVLNDVITTAPRSVSPDAVRKFEQWGRMATNA